MDTDEHGCKHKLKLFGFLRVHPWLICPVLNVIHEDADLLVVHKPAGLVCHPTKDGEMSSLIGRARLYLNNPSPAGVGEGGAIALGEGGGAKPDFLREPAPISPQPSTLNSQPDLINRLDRETSGVVLLAKNPQTAGELGKILENRAVEKEYLAIVHGHVAAGQGTIDAPLGKDERSRVAIKDCVRPDGAPAQTEFFVERRFVQHSSLNPQPSTYSLLRVIPATGRKHQIRIHLAHLGHPIVGDKIYGGDEDSYLAFVEGRLTAAQRARLILENHALHARALRFVWRGRSWEFSCPPEPWFQNFLTTDGHG
jgi:23S rRNA pseudouridine1911/1915/1917 synthase